MKQRLEGLASAATGRPVLTLGVTLTLALAGALLALGLKPSAGSDTFVSRSSGSFQATDQDHRLFGGDAIVILVKEPLTDLVETKDLARISFLEACLAGQYLVPSQQLESFEPAPAGAHAPYGGWSSPCGRLMRSRPVQVVYRPGTFLNRALPAVNAQRSPLESLVSSGGNVACAPSPASARRMAPRLTPPRTWLWCLPTIAETTLPPSLGVLGSNTRNWRSMWRSRRLRQIRPAWDELARS